MPVQNHTQEALQAFAEDVYHCSLEFGPRDVRTSLGYYNIGKVLQSSGNAEGALACADVVVSIWAAALEKTVLGAAATAKLKNPNSEPSTRAELPVGRLQLMEVVDMLQDAAKLRSSMLGPGHTAVAEAQFVTALALIQLGEPARAIEQLDLAASLYPAHDEQHAQLLSMARSQAIASRG